jgi:DNA invertase Pin-like site-specific DNA recombinase
MSRKDRLRHRLSAERQVERCREMAEAQHLLVESRHVFLDADHDGEWPPSCWAAEGSEGLRPALGALVEAVEAGLVARVVVHHPERLGTSSDVLTALADLFAARQVKVVTGPKALAGAGDESERFAAETLRDSLQCGAADDRERRKAVRLEELERLRAKMHRLEREIAGM